MTTRRNFLGMLGALAAAPAIKPLAALVPVEHAVIGQWADYCSVCDFAFPPAIPTEIFAILAAQQQYLNKLTGAFDIVEFKK